MSPFHEVTEHDEHLGAAEEAPARQLPQFNRVLTWIGPVLFVGCALTLSLTNRSTAPYLAHGLGSAFAHEQLALRLAGWLFSGGLSVVLGALLFTRPKALMTGATPWLLGIWLALSGVFVGARHDSARNGSIYRAYNSDGRYLSFGWGWGALAVLIGVVGLIGVIPLFRGRGRFQPRSKPMLRVIQIWYFGCVLAGFGYALFGSFAAAKTH